MKEVKRLIRSIVEVKAFSLSEGAKVGMCLLCPKTSNEAEPIGSRPRKRGRSQQWRQIAGRRVVSSGPRNT